MWCCLPSIELVKEPVKTDGPKQLVNLSVYYETKNKHYFLTAFRNENIYTISSKSIKVYCGFKNDFTDAEIANMIGTPETNIFDDEGLLYYAYCLDENTFLWLQSRDEAVELKNLLESVKKA